MGMEDLARREVSESRTERGEHDIQRELATVRMQMDSVSDEIKSEHGMHTISAAMAAAQGKEGPGASSLSADSREYGSLVEKKGSLEEERNEFYRNNPELLASRLKELYKNSLREHLTSDKKQLEAFLHGRNVQGVQTAPNPDDWFVRPSGDSESTREYQSLLNIHNELEDAGPHDSSKAREFSESIFRQANRELYEELQAKDAPASPQPKQSFQDQLSPETAEFVTNRIVETDLSYQDADIPEEQKRGILQEQRGATKGKRYAESLVLASETGGLEAIRSLADGMRTTMLSEAARLGIPVSPYGRSKSWAMWDIGKQYHFFSNPDQNDPRYEIGNPLESESKQEEMINRHLGWEAYTAYLTNEEFRNRVVSDPAFKPALDLFNKPPKERGTLSSYDLAELGKVLRTAG
ncbi:MAG: hypothetical protein ACM3TU_02220 [Bacillota bacterium]